MISKFHFIEILRFVTSLAVVVRHYHFFFLPRSSISTIQVLADPSMQPFYFFLQTFYMKGDYAVPIFWGISGFIFALVYLEQRKNTSGKQFFINRFSRLYPLHFITLILVSILQIVNHTFIGSHQIIGNNDVFRFFLHILFVSGYEGESFNLPVWSVSVEILIYFAFFLSIILLNKFKYKYALLIYSLSLLIDKFLLSSIFIDCFRMFFTGVLVYYLNISVKNKLLLSIISIFIIAVSFVGNFKIFLFTPGILLLFISFEYLIKSEMKENFDFFGNLTYSMYLLHIPSMLTIILIFYFFSLPDSIFLDSRFFLSYISFIFFISFVSYKYFEKPLNRYFRNKLGNAFK